MKIKTLNCNVEEKSYLKKKEIIDCFSVLPYKCLKLKEHDKYRNFEDTKMYLIIFNRSLRVPKLIFNNNNIYNIIIVIIFDSISKYFV